MAILRHRTSRDEHALISEHFRERNIGQWIARVFRSDHFLEQRTHGRSRTGAAAFRTQFAREEMLELEDAARRRHVLVARRARNRRFVQAELLGHVAQYKRLQRDLAVLEEWLLMRDDALGDPLNRFEALLCVADQP